MTVAITQTISGAAGGSTTEIFGGESKVSIAFTGLATSTIYVVLIGQPGGLLAPTQLTWNRQCIDGAKGECQTYTGTSDGGGAMTIVHYPQTSGSYTIHAYAISALTDAASAIAGNTFTVLGRFAVMAMTCSHCTSADVAFLFNSWQCFNCGRHTTNDGQKILPDSLCIGPNTPQNMEQFGWPYEDEEPSHQRNEEIMGLQWGTSIRGGSE